MIDKFMEDLAERIRGLPEDERARVRSLVEDPGTRALVYLLKHKFPFEVIDKMTSEQRVSLADTVMKIVGDQQNLQ